MKRNLKKTLWTVALLALSLTAQAADGTLRLTYQPSDAVIVNPERGLFTHHEFYSDRNDELDLEQLDQLHQQGMSLIFTAYVMRDFRNKDISKAYLNRVRRNLRAIRRAGMKAVVRFCYTYSEDDKPWDAPWEVTSRHIDQLAPILQENADVIALLEAGFVGVWGEWYYTDHYNFQPQPNEYGPRRQVLDKLLQVMPRDRFVAVRYPVAKMCPYGLQYTDTLSLSRAYDGSDLSRISFHNDCFLATNDDMGTFNEVPENRQYWLWESRYVPMGGETCAPSVYCEVDNALKDFAAYHWSYLNQDYHPAVLEKWERENFMDIVRKRLGYRLVLRSGEFTERAVAGQPFSLALDIANEGWAAPYNPRDVEVVFRKGKSKFKVKLDADPRFWFAGQTSRVEAAFRLPAGMPAGTYEVYLNLPDPQPTLYGKPDYSIQLANKKTWESSTGYNRLCTVRVEAGSGQKADEALPEMKAF